MQKKALVKKDVGKTLTVSGVVESLITLKKNDQFAIVRITSRKQSIAIKLNGSAYDKGILGIEYDDENDCFDEVMGLSSFNFPNKTKLDTGNWLSKPASAEKIRMDVTGKVELDEKGDFTLFTSDPEDVTVRAGATRGMINDPFRDQV